MITSLQPTLPLKSPKVAFAGQKPTAQFSAPQADSLSIRFGNQTPDPNSSQIRRFSKSLGPKIDEKNNKGWTPLYEALTNGDLSRAKALLEAGADPNITNNIGRTPLMRAAENKNVTEIVSLLIQHGANVNAQDTGIGETPLIVAVRHHNVPAVKLLLEALADPNFSRNEGQLTPLHIAMGSSATTETVQLLLAHGASPNIPNEKGETPLHWATQFLNNEDKVKALLDAGAYPLVKDNKGITPLDIAIRNHQPEAAKLIIESKPMMNARLEEQVKYLKTALLKAATKPQ